MSQGLYSTLDHAGVVSSSLLYRIFGVAAQTHRARKVDAQILPATALINEEKPTTLPLLLYHLPFSFVFPCAPSSRLTACTTEEATDGTPMPPTPAPTVGNGDDDDW